MLRPQTRMPDIVLLAQPGVLWVKPGEGTWASHGGWRDEDTHVALLVAGAHLSGRVDKTPVPTSQLAPLLLRALGMGKVRSTGIASGTYARIAGHLLDPGC